MIANSIEGSEALLSKAYLISVDHVRSFKPAPEVNRYLRNCLQGSSLNGDLYLVSSNAFDLIGAKSAGLQAIWVDLT